MTKMVNDLSEATVPIGVLHKEEQEEKDESTDEIDDKKHDNSDNEPTQEIEETLPILTTSKPLPATAPKKRKANDEGTGEESTAKKQKKAMFSGMVFHLLHVGHDFDAIMTIIRKNGGTVHYNLTQRVTHLVSGDHLSAPLQKLVTVVVKRHPALEHVSASWILTKNNI